MATRFNSDLVEDVARRKIVVFVGAGASKWANPAGGGAFKNWIEFLNHANSMLRSKRVRGIISDLIEARDYLLASELLKEKLDLQWTALLAAEFQQAADVSRLHSALVALDPRIVITTNFDKLIENAWTGVATTRYPTIITKVDGQAFRIFRSEDKYIVKLHGSVDSPDGITFDKSSYQRDAFANRYYSDLLNTLLLTHTFVFVGFSMVDPAVSSIVENAAFRFPDTRPHYIFQSGKAVPEIDDLAKRLRKLYVIRYPEADHHVALAKQLESLAAEAARRRIEISAAGIARPI